MGDLHAAAADPWRVASEKPVVESELTVRRSEGESLVAEPNIPLSTPQSLRDVATAILQGEAYTDQDAVRVAGAYLRTLARDT